MVSYSLQQTEKADSFEFTLKVQFFACGALKTRKTGYSCGGATSDATLAAPYVAADGVNRSFTTKLDAHLV